jgi:hypothetical protein
MIDAAWIDDWSEHYDKGYDAKVQDGIGPQVHERGYYEPEELLAVGRWKARGRTQRSLKAHTDKEIRDITKMAPQAELPYQHRILTLLRALRCRRRRRC